MFDAGASRVQGAGNHFAETQDFCQQQPEIPLPVRVFARRPGAEREGLVG